jgi:hypothetical protein
VKKHGLIYPVAIALAAGAIVLLVVMSLVPSRTNVNGVTISASGFVVAPGTNSGPVMFYITNAEPSLVHLGHLEVQLASSNRWMTVSEEWSPMLQLKVFGRFVGRKSQWAGGLLGGSHRTCYVQPPMLQARWRVRLTYLRQDRGLYALYGRARFALAKHTWAPLINENVVSFLPDQHEVGEPRVFAVILRNVWAMPSARVRPLTEVCSSIVARYCLVPVR